MFTGHALTLFMIFFPPFTLCLCLAFNVDVSFFVGRGALLCLIMIPWMIAVPLVHYWTVPRGWFFFASVLIPCVFFAFIAGSYRERTMVVEGALMNPDCHAFWEKRDLQKAHETALFLYRNCSRQAEREDWVIQSVTQCPSYPLVMYQMDLVREFSYLQSLEARFPCAGICGGEHTRLWSNPGTKAPSCDLFAAQWVHGGNIQASIMLGFCAVAILSSIPGYQFLVKPFLDNFYSAKMVAWEV